MKIIDGPESIQGSAEWHSFRKTKIMASMAPSIMGVGYDTPYQLWRQMLDLDPPKEITPAMQRGIELEPEALACVEKAIGYEFKKVVATSDQYPWLGASFDGMSACGTIIEIKTPYRASNAFEWWQKNMDIYYSQFQVQMFVSDQLCCYVFVYMGNGDGVPFSVDRDDAYINEMIPKLKEFYDCVMSYTQPKLTEKDYIIREDEQWNMWAKQYKEAKQKAFYYKEREEECRERLLELAGQSNTRGAGVSVQKIVSKGTINWNGVMDEYLKDIDLEKHRKQSKESWRITSD